MQLQNYFYFNGIPYEHLSFGIQKKIDQLIERMKREHICERMFLYQDHYFNIIQDNSKPQRQFESDLPDDLTEEIIKLYLKTTGQATAVN